MLSRCPSRLPASPWPFAQPRHHLPSSLGTPFIQPASILQVIKPRNHLFHRLARSFSSALACQLRFSRSSSPDIACFPRLACSFSSALACQLRFSRSSSPAIACFPRLARSFCSALACQLRFSRSSSTGIACFHRLARSFSSALACQLRFSRSSSPGIASFPRLARSFSSALACQLRFSRSSSPASPAFLDSLVRPAPPSPARVESADQQARIIGQLQSGMTTLIRQNQLLNEKVEKLLAEQRERERLSQRRDMPNLRLSGEGNVFIGSSTAGHVISREVYERAFYASNHPKDFVLKLLPAVFNDVELARSNFNGGPVFNGTTHVMKDALVQRVEFQAIIAQMVQDYPGCITERFHVELRKAVNSKCRRIAHRLRLVQIHWASSPWTLYVPHLSHFCNCHYNFVTLCWLVMFNYYNLFLFESWTKWFYCISHLTCII